MLRFLNAEFIFNWNYYLLQNFVLLILTKMRIQKKDHRDEMMVRLALDARQRTLSELVQEREWALREIERLNGVLAETRNANATNSTQRATNQASTPTACASQPAWMRVSDVCNYLGIGRSTLYHFIDERNFPKPVKIGSRAVRWHYVDVEEWLSSAKTV